MLLRNGDVLSPVRWMHTRPLLPLARSGLVIESLNAIVSEAIDKTAACTEIRER